jgi:hypothetical protein
MVTKSAYRRFDGNIAKQTRLKTLDVGFEPRADGRVSCKSNVGNIGIQLEKRFFSQPKNETTRRKTKMPKDNQPKVRTATVPVFGSSGARRLPKKINQMRLHMLTIASVDFNLVIRQTLISSEH